jgi:putative serine protease PepD
LFVAPWDSEAVSGNGVNEHWWSDALNDPWRDPDTHAVLNSPPVAREPDPQPPRLSGELRKGRFWWLVVTACIIAALVGGLLGAVVGIRFGGADNRWTPPFAAPAPRPAPESFAGVAQLVLPSVVTIRVSMDGGTALGSGFIATPEGHIITNDHVVSGAEGLASVIFDDGSTGQAEVVGTDPESDIAVLRLLRHGDLTPAHMGNSDLVAVGDQVMAFGSPLALRGTVTAGIVSALDRPISTGTSHGGTRYYAAIQTDAAINHGNSGGPLVDAAGQVIGINAVIKSLADDEQTAGNIGLAFAIPINHARRVATEIIETGKAHRTVIGAELDDASSSTVGGVRLSEVSAAGPAAQAGLRQGDLIITFNGQPLSEAADLIALVRKTAPGAVVRVTYKRGSTSQNVLVKLVEDAD